MAANDWNGLDLESLRDLEQRLCRCKIRRDPQVIADNGGTVLAKGNPSLQALGRLCNLLFDLCRRKARKSSRPQKNTIAGYLSVNYQETKPTQVTNFFEGRATDDSWFELGPHIFRYIIQGPNPFSDSARQEILTRMEHFFFRKDSPEQVPACFEKDRLGIAEPCSITEAAAEISWVIRDHQNHDEVKRPAKLVLVSGGLPFPFDDAGGGPKFGEDLAYAIRVGIDVTVISNPTSSEAIRSLDEFCEKQKIGKNEFKVLSPDSSDPQAWRWLTPIFRALYLRPRSLGESASLYLLRRIPSRDDGSPALLPSSLAISATRPELDSFEAWLDGLEHAARPDPPEPEPASPPPSSESDSGRPSADTIGAEG